jgi:hypothetical protein
MTSSRTRKHVSFALPTRTPADCADNKAYRRKMNALYQSRRAGLANNLGADAQHRFDLDVCHELQRCSCLNTPFAPPLPFPSSLRITTRVGLFCWTLSLRVGACATLTAWEVLRRYHRFLHMPVLPEEFRLLNWEQRRAVGKAYWRRGSEGLRRIDFLLERTRLVGLKRCSEGWEAILSWS